MIHEVVTRLAQVLSASPDPVLPAASIGPHRPAAAGDLPILALSVTVEHGGQLGLARLVRGSQLLDGGSRVREDFVGLLLSGTVGFEAWANRADATVQISRAVEAKLGAAEPALRERGFALLRPSVLEPADAVAREGGAGAPFRAWRQHLACAFVFEWIEGGEETGGGLIERVEVDLPQQRPDESFSVA